MWDQVEASQYMARALRRLRQLHLLHGAPARMTELLLKGTSGPTVSG